MFNQEFYDKMIEMHADMRYMRKWSEDHDTNDKAVHAAFEKRMKTIEDDRMKIIGGAAVISVLGGLLVALFFK